MNEIHVKGETRDSVVAWLPHLKRVPKDTSSHKLCTTHPSKQEKRKKNEIEIHVRTKTHLIIRINLTLFPCKPSRESLYRI